MEIISSNGHKTDATTAPYELDSGLRRSKKNNQNAMPDVPDDVAISCRSRFLPTNAFVSAGLAPTANRLYWQSLVVR